ncbi:hypothetical protein FBY22_3557 [Streptomyces sp. SLBN-31]|jgi:hypothetical protein|nr:hypothetical protein FBY22_3557 [Streptomyces sp. SLBN-31]
MSPSPTTAPVRDGGERLYEPVVPGEACRSWLSASSAGCWGTGSSTPPTYCSSGESRRNLQHADPSAPGKGAAAVGPPRRPRFTKSAGRRRTRMRPVPPDVNHPVLQGSWQEPS